MVRHEDEGEGPMMMRCKCNERIDARRGNEERVINV